jgi:hypothetical protein
MGDGEGVILKCDNEVRAKAGGALLGDPIDDVKGSRLKRVPIMDVR